MESLTTYLIFLLLVLLIAAPYWWRTIHHRRQAKQIRARNEKVGLVEPATLHPRIDLLTCIGCGSCVRVCPEDVLGIVDGRAAILNGVRCIGHALCADVCPVGAITMGFGKPRQGMEIPYYDENYRTNIDGLYIVGELGGIGLIKNAIEQGVKAISRLAQTVARSTNGKLDVAIIGAGPAGIGAALAAQANGLRYVVLEQYNFGGSILHYPRQKLVLTTPVELPLYGKLKASEISKEELLATFASIVDEHKLNFLTQKKVETISKNGEGFIVGIGSTTVTASNVVLALGRRGSPRKLGVPGEDLPKVCYQLIDAETYTNKHILIVGGGDSAIEAAVGLARQRGNTVTLSYRREAFVRLKEKNEHNIAEMMKRGQVRVVFESEVVEIRPTEVVLRVKGSSVQAIPNDFVFIFAGGEMPTELLKKIGVRMRKEEG